MVYTGNYYPAYTGPCVTAFQSPSAQFAHLHCMDWYHNNIRMGALKKVPLTCHTCKGLDHSTMQCPLQEIPGWFDIFPHTQTSANPETTTGNADSIQEHEDLAATALQTHPSLNTPHAASSHPAWRPGTNAHCQTECQNTPPPNANNHTTPHGSYKGYSNHSHYLSKK